MDLLETATLMFRARYNFHEFEKLAIISFLLCDVLFY